MGAKHTLYKVPGKYRLKSGTTYSVLEVFDKRSLANSLDRGWHLSIEAAVAAVKGSARPEVSAPQTAAIVAAPAIADTPAVVDTDDQVEQADEPDDAPPTRAEMEAKARELGIKFDGRTSDKLLLKRITEALEG